MKGQPKKEARVARKSDKAPDAFRTISEVSDDLDLPQHVLRFWESRFTQIRPLKRGGGRRLYRPDHIALLRGIRALLYEDGMTIRGAQKILRDRGAKAVIARGTSGGLPEFTPDEVARQLAKLGQTGKSGTSEASPKKIRESIKRLEEVLSQLEQA